MNIMRNKTEKVCNCVMRHMENDVTQRVSKYSAN